MNFGKVFEIFPGASTEVLCQLAELRDLLPSKVKELGPEASALQIAAFMNLAEEARQQRKKEKRSSARSHERRARKLLEPVSSVEQEKVEKKSEAEGGQGSQWQKVPSDQKSEFMSRLKKLIRAEEGGARASRCTTLPRPCEQARCC